MSKGYIQEHFANIEAPRIERSVFDRSHCHKTTFNAGELIPVYVDEALPGDSFKARMTIFVRLATPLKPIMDNLYLDMHFFAIPNRLLWTHWQEFCGEVKIDNWNNGLSSQDFFIPWIVPSTENHWFAEGSLADYFGLPTDQTMSSVDEIPQISALPFRAYNLCFNEWYRDENLQYPLDVETGDGPDAEGEYSIQFRNRRKDYFTSALPWPQKGAAVDIPIGVAAPVFGTGKTLGLYDGTNFLGTSGWQNGMIPANGIGASTDFWDNHPGGSGMGGTPVEDQLGVGVPTKAQIGTGSAADTGLYADLTDATAITINELRQAFQLQKLLERDARGGTRYTEIIRNHFGVVSPDARLQRPEYLGGGTIRFQTNPVQQTSGTPTSGTPQGNLAAFSVATGSMGFSKSFVEHCVLLGIVSIRADNTYQQGINRMWRRKTREDFYWPSFAHLGEQIVYNSEIYAQGTAELDDGIWAYQERYAEYRYSPSLVTGLFRSTSIAGGLDIWHLAMLFPGGIPRLADVIVEEPPVDRVIAVSEKEGPQFLFDSHIELKCARPMPVYSTPGLVDHF